MAGRDGTKQTGVAALYYAFSKRTEIYGAAYTNRYTDGYKLDTFNFAAFVPRNAASSSTSGISTGIVHRF